MVLSDCTTALALGLGLAVDAVAVGAAAGVAAAPLRRGEALRMATVFGLFQAVMPALGWLAGSALVGAWAEVGRWLAAILLAIVAWRLVQGVGGNPQSTPEAIALSTRPNPFSWPALFATGIATSIDALAAGVALASLKQTPATAMASFVIIGLATLVCVWPAVLLGGRIGARGGRIAAYIGALVLLAVAGRVLLGD